MKIKIKKIFFKKLKKIKIIKENIYFLENSCIKLTLSAPCIIIKSTIMVKLQWFGFLYGGIFW